MSYIVKMEMESQKINDIMDRLTKAQDEIYKCYSELKELGVLKIKETATTE